MLRKSRTFVVIFFIISVAIFVMFNLARAASTDRTIPVIEMDSESVTVSVEDGDEAILKGVTAMDGKDGDITENLFIESRTTFLEKGRFEVTIAVADKDNHINKATREVIYSDYRSPQFSLTNPLKFQTTKESEDDLNIARGLSAKDVIDGNISNKIKISSEYSINSFNTGDYYMEFIVSNSMGDTIRLPVTVTIYSSSQESGLPQIILTKYLVNTTVGQAVDILSLIEQINYHNSTYRRGEDGNYYNGEFSSDGNAIMISSDSIQIESNIDWNTPGTYEVKIIFSDESNGLSNFVRCYIVVY
ncbi:MAG: hypothetical protein IKF90_00015 [Parasporobacterium sp.]|nr:hypothetical protein [Parasporobacterium sp.]